MRIIAHTNNKIVSVYCRTLLLSLFLCACTRKPNTPIVHVSLADNGRAVKFKGLDYAIISEINRDTTKGIWQNLFPVYAMPADTSLNSYQPVQLGTYLVKDSAVFFTPDTPFVKGKAYFMRYYRFNASNTMWDFLKRTKKPGTIPYTDLIFKR